MLAEVLVHNVSLKSLYLDGNPLNPEGAKLLAKAMESNYTLTQLWYLSSADKSKKTKKERKKKTEISLGNTKIGKEGAIFLAQIIVFNSSLKKLRF